MVIHAAPADDVIESEYEVQGKNRYVVLENNVIDDAYGVYDYDGEMWLQDPYMSEDSAKHLRNIKNKGAQRL